MKKTNLVLVCLFCFTFKPIVSNLNLFITQTDVKKLLGLDKELYYVRDGTVNRYALGFVISVPSEVENLLFSWYSSADTTPLHYTISASSSHPVALQHPNINISRTGEVPFQPEVWQLGMKCTGNEAAEVIVTLQIAITWEQLKDPGQNTKTTNLKLIRKKVCRALEIPPPNDVARLVRKLFQDHDPNIRPIANSSAAIDVKFGATLLSFDLEEKETYPTLNTVLWLNFGWNNEYLKWDPANFGNVKKLRLPANLLWVPDMMLYNDATGEFHKYLQIGHRPTNVVISNTGDIIWIPPTKASVACRFDEVSKEYLCELKFGSWVFSSLGIDLKLNSEDVLDLSNLKVNKKFELVKSEGKRNSIQYECCPESYLDITFKLVFKKKQEGSWLSG